MDQRVRFDLIQCLRAIAATAVVLFHAAGATLKYSMTPALTYPLWHRYGGYGVDLFFVISGFVIYYTARGLPAGEFALRRLKRIVPIYWILTLAAVALVAAGLGTAQTLTPTALITSLGFVSFSQGLQPLLYVGWTLEFEMYFYAVVALALCLRRNPWTLTIGFLCAMVVLGAVLRPSNPIAVFTTKPIVLEFVAGVLICQVYLRSIGKVELASLAIALIALAVTVPATLGVLITCAMLVGLAAWLNRPMPEWIRLLGDASYSIYLIQVFTVVAVAKAMAIVWPAHHPEILVALSTAVTIVAGVVAHLLIEKPIAQMLRGREATRRSIDTPMTR